MIRGPILDRVAIEKSHDDNASLHTMIDLDAKHLQVDL